MGVNNTSFGLGISGTGPAFGNTSYATTVGGGDGSSFNASQKNYIKEVCKSAVAPFISRFSFDVRILKNSMNDLSMQVRINTKDISHLRKILKDLDLLTKLELKNKEVEVDGYVRELKRAQRFERSWQTNLSRNFKEANSNQQYEDLTIYPSIDTSVKSKQLQSPEDMFILTKVEQIKPDKTSIQQKINQQAQYRILNKSIDNDKNILSNGILVG